MYVYMFILDVVLGEAGLNYAFSALGNCLLLLRWTIGAKWPVLNLAPTAAGILISSSH